MSETFLSVVESLMMGDVLTWVPVRIRLTMSTHTTFDTVAAIIQKVQNKSDTNRDGFPGCFTLSYRNILFHVSIFVFISEINLLCLEFIRAVLINL